MGLGSGSRHSKYVLIAEASSVHYYFPAGIIPANSQTLNPKPLNPKPPCLQCGNFRNGRAVVAKGCRDMFPRNTERFSQELFMPLCPDPWCSKDPLPMCHQASSFFLSYSCRKTTLGSQGIRISLQGWVLQRRVP